LVSYGKPIHSRKYKWTPYNGYFIHELLAELDDDWVFGKHFKALYGKGSYIAFRASYDNTFKNQWQEIIEVNKEMSGM
jgi:hypothetical protein